MDFGTKLQKLRKENNMSQEMLSQRINVSRQAISKWEKNLALPDTDNIVRLSKFFQVPIEYLLTDNYEEKQAANSFESSSDNKPKPADMLNAYKNGIKRNVKNIMLIIAGCFFIITACCLTPVMQYIDMQNNGFCYTYKIEYIKHFPLFFLLIFGIVLIIFGVINIILYYIQRSAN